MFTNLATQSLPRQCIYRSREKNYQKLRRIINKKKEILTRSGTGPTRKQIWSREDTRVEGRKQKITKKYTAGIKKEGVDVSSYSATPQAKQTKYLHHVSVTAAVGGVRDGCASGPMRNTIRAISRPSASKTPERKLISSRKKLAG